MSTQYPEYPVPKIARTKSNQYPEYPVGRVPNIQSLVPKIPNTKTLGTKSTQYLVPSSNTEDSCGSSLLHTDLDNNALCFRWEETRAEYLKQLANELIEGKFRQLVVDEDILNLQVFVEDVYETRIGPNDANLRVNDMMKLIEARFLSELMKLDKIPAEIVSKMEVSFYTEEARIVKVAEQAARKLLELERLIETLNKAYALPYQRTGRGAY